MIILKYNTLSSESLFKIERQYLRWVDDNNNMRSYAPTTELNVLDFSCTEDLYGFILGMFAKLQVFDTLNISASQFLDFLIDVDKTYQDTPYHSFFHATDVVVVLYYIMMDLKAKRYLTNLEIANLFISTICHDAGHTGYNNDYHVKLNTELAIRYSHTSVLESLSVEIALGLIQKHGISMINQTVLRSLILSTDMTSHYDLLQEANTLEDILSSVNLWDEDSNDDLLVTETLSISDHSEQTHDDDDEEEDEDNRYTILDDKQRLSFMKILLHAADISNTVRVWPISKQWSDLIVQEFFRQGDAEKQAGLQVSPGMDRDLATQASISLKFGDYVVKPYFEAVAGLLPSARIFLDVLEDNRQEWIKLKSSPFATSITNYFNGFLQQRFSNVHSKPILSRKVSVPAGTVALPSPSNSSTNSVNKPMPILRTSSHSNLLISPQSSTSSELRRNSADHRNKMNNTQDIDNHHHYDQFKLYLEENVKSTTATTTGLND